MTAVHAPANEALDARVEALGLSHLIESPFNPRKTFDPKKLDELAESIRAKGVVEPIVVRAWSKHSEKFEIVCGARRYRAAQLAGVTHLLAVIRTFTDVQVVEIMAIENGQRDDVAPLEEAAGYKQLLGLDKGYSAALIASKIGRSEQYVWDRLKLLDLIPEVKALLAQGIIGVEHAEIIAKLKPGEQQRVAQKSNGGLFAHDYALEFDRDPKTNLRVKPVSVRELRQWIARNIRFDVQHAAQAAPLDFGLAAQRVEQAQAEPGRGKKVVPITFEHMCPYNAADEKERTYGATAWKKAVGKDGPTCEHAVLGVVVAGRQYGDTFHVCIARDKCRTHWAESVKAKEKAAKLRDSGQPKQAARVEKSAHDKQQERYKREQLEREVRRKAWDALEPQIVADAVAQVKPLKALTAAHAKVLLGLDSSLDQKALKEHMGATWFKTPVAALLVSAVNSFYNTGFDDYVKEIAKPLGLNIKRLEAIRDKHQPTKDAAAPAKGKK